MSIQQKISQFDSNFTRSYVIKNEKYYSIPKLPLCREIFIYEKTSKRNT